MALLDTPPAIPKEVATPALLTAQSAAIPLAHTVKITCTTHRDMTELTAEDVKRELPR